MKIKNKINYSFIITFFVALIVLAWAVDIYTSNLIRKNIDSYLHSSSRARAEHIRTFLKDQETISVILAAASIYRDLLKEPIGSSQYPVIKAKIDKRLVRTIEADPDIYEAMIIDRNGKIIASSDKTKEGSDKSNDLYFTEAKRGVYLKDLYFSDTVNKINYTISAPVNDDNGKFLGVSVLRYLPDGLYNITKNENGLGDTEENFLIDKDKYFITPSRFLGEGVVLKQKVETQNSTDCFDKNEVEYVKKNGYSGLIEKFGEQLVTAKDYRNADITGTHAYIPETGWCLITKVDTSQLLSYRFPLFLTLLVIALIVLVFFSILGYFVSGRITNPIELLQLAVSKIKGGNLDYKVEVNSKDEIGELSESFNEMVMAVKQSRADIDLKVKEQTKDLSDKSKELTDQKNAILNILEDVEAEKKNIEGLANDLEKFKLAVDNASDQVVITDVEGIVIYGNATVERITGFKPEEAMGKKAGALWKTPMPLEYYKNMWDVIKIQKKPFISEIQNKRKNGEFYMALISISPVLNNKGDVVYFVAIERDITKEKEVDKAKTEFVSLASHQLRTPLSAINWYTEMLLAGDAGEINEEQRKYLTEVSIGNKRMVALVNALLNVSRLDLGTFIVEPEPVNVVEMAKSVIGELKPLALEKKINIKEEYSQGITVFQADQKLLRIVFQNLLSNAIKYTNENGTVSLIINSIPKGGMFDGKALLENSLAISVSDSGIGIPSDQKDKMFMKLFRADNARETETEGTGLGLYIVKSIIEQSGGSVWFESEENKGTQFFVTFPIEGMKKKEGSRKLD